MEHALHLALIAWWKQRLNQHAFNIALAIWNLLICLEAQSQAICSLFLILGMEI
jgi:hypothetical protein